MKNKILKINKKKPNWIKLRIPIFNEIKNIKKKLRKNYLHTVCEESSCPNIIKCFNENTATIMILGNKCTRKCPFCDVLYGNPKNINYYEPFDIIKLIIKLNINYIVITSVNRDDLYEGGANHFSKCIGAIKRLYNNIKIEILVPDFRGKIDIAIKILSKNKPNVFNHNIETIKNFYLKVKPGGNYLNSLNLLKKYKNFCPSVKTKSGLMVGLGETDKQIINVMKDIKKNQVEIITIGQYISPSEFHLPIKRWIKPNKFYYYAKKGYILGFNYIASGPLIRSSYKAKNQIYGKKI
ncbi:Lipoyl synthase [Candidatus Portiera aleyrodidarum]|uniref:lipoyl synthase n=1 Tax=Candidatus Portiera aleyrodidarum TaxID=91844 RepID=UPI0005DA345D|nr:lipoyl synthase [Candidatus Portiera aleyrodidarum]CEL12446.1 Lipoyl synthase [Candidatus Portiera aleyrodidarum]